MIVLLASFLSLVSHIQEDKEIPGMAAVIVQDGKPTFYHGGYANLATKQPVTGDTLFELASITKVFTSTGIAYEVQTGRLKGDDTFLGFKWIDLATHTSGLPRAAPEQDSKAQVYKFLSDFKPTSHKYHYSNLGFELLRDLLVQTSQSPTYLDALKTILLTPLGMTSTGFEAHGATPYDRHGKPRHPTQPRGWPGGGPLQSTSKDMAAFLLANMGLKGPAPLKDAMFLAQKPVYRVDDDLSLGLGWNVLPDLIDKDGALKGASSYIGFTKDKRIGIVLLTNKGGIKMKKVGRSLLRKLHKHL